MRERFYSKTQPEPNSGCLLWTGSAFYNGYGAVWVSGRMRGAHRVAWELERGQIPKDLQVCHRCDVRACVNIDHLFLGTVLDNMRDARSKGRTRTPNCRGEAHGMAKLSARDVAQIRAVYAGG